jgi:hypothetical protein
MYSGHPALAPCMSFAPSASLWSLYACETNGRHAPRQVIYSPFLSLAFVDITHSVRLHTSTTSALTSAALSFFISVQPEDGQFPYLPEPATTARLDTRCRRPHCEADTCMRRASDYSHTTSKQHRHAIPNSTIDFAPPRRTYWFHSATDGAFAKVRTRRNTSEQNPETTFLDRWHGPECKPCHRAFR